jgi:hypothetical protein
VLESHHASGIVSRYDKASQALVLKCILYIIIARMPKNLYWYWYSILVCARQLIAQPYSYSITICFRQV